MSDEPTVDTTADALPVDTLREATPYLRRPFTPEAIKFKVQSVFGGNSGCLIVAYIDARLVIERLNRVVPDMWWAKYEAVPDTKLMVCRLTIAGITREDVGESPKGLSKDLYSDALKRAAVHFGVGVSVYALAQIRVFMDGSKGRIEKRRVGQKETVVLTDQGHEWLKGGYRKWLESQTNFGPALDHGDVEGAGGVDAGPEEPEDTFTPEAPEPLTDERAVELMARCESAYDAIRSVDSRALPPGQYQAWLRGAAHSHGELERLAQYLESRVTEERS